MLQLALVAGLLSSCASVSTPEGGDRDTVPPKLVGTIPPNQATNVEVHAIKLLFDEYVVTSKLQEQLIITPEPPGEYKLREEGRSITLEFKKDLAANTTYQFDFRDGITDATEHNKPAEAIRLTFSTGTSIDSGAVNGQVRDLLTDQPKADVLVGLWAGPDTVDPRRTAAYYRTFTDSRGQFQLSSIKPGSYRLLAVADRNKNRKYDLTEGVAYRKTHVTVGGKDTLQYVLRLGVADRKAPFVLSRKEESGLVTLQLNEGVTRAEVRQAGNRLPSRVSTQTPRQVQVAGEVGTQLKGATVLLVDSAGNAKIDTLDLSFGHLDENKASKRQPVKGSTRLTTDQDGRYLRVEFSSAVRVKAGAIGYLAQKSAGDTTYKPLGEVILPKQAHLDSSATVLLITLPKPAGAKLTQQLVWDSTAFSTYSGAPVRLAATQLEAASSADPEGKGTITATIQTTLSSYWVDLLDDRFKVVRTLRTPRVLDLRNLEPGTYYLRARLDKNNDNRWQGPDPTLVLEPEPIWFYPQPVQVRANWEQHFEVRF